MSLNNQSAPDSATSRPLDESTEIGLPNEGNGCTPGTMEMGFHLEPVKPFTSGEGLPYAPIDWPRPGDKWSWKVGRKTRAGFFCQRYLYLPIRLQKPGRTKQSFSGRAPLERWLCDKFPDVDINTFFASFSWKIPAAKAEEKPEDKDHEIEVPQTFQKKRKQIPHPFSAVFRPRTKHSKQFISLPTENTGVTINVHSTEETGTTDSTAKDSKSTTELESDEVFSHQNSISPARIFAATGHSPDPCEVNTLDNPPESPTEVVVKDFDKYLDSLEDILGQPLPQAPLSSSAINKFHAIEGEIAEARMKISSLFAMDFSLLVTTKDLTEITNLLSKLRNDPSLTADQLFKLKLIEEIPFRSKEFLETKQVIEQADKFFADLETNIAKATSLRNEYKESKEKAAQLQEEIDSSTGAIREIDDQIAQLQSRRAELCGAVEFKVMLKDELNSAQRTISDSLPSIVQKIRLANSTKAEWELKKTNSIRREAEILARYAPLKGFSL